jgi:hypothetical protein
MKKIQLLVIAIMCTTLMYAQTSIVIIPEKDTLKLGDSQSGALVSKIIKFNYDSTINAIFAQVVMDVHHLDPFNLPEIIMNGKNIQASILFPSLSVDTKFHFFKIKSKNGATTIINSPIGKDAAKLSFLLSSQDLIQGNNFIRITVKDRSIENLDDFSLTNGIITFRSKTKNDYFTDYSK